MKTLRLHLLGRIVLVICLVLVLAGCSEKDDEVDSLNSSPEKISVNIANSAAKALPAIPATVASSSRLFAVSDPVSDSEIENFFKFECYMPDGEDNCPSSVTKDPLVNKYTVTTLIGTIYHAELYLEEAINLEESQCTSSTVNSSSFVTDDGGGNTSTYLIDFYNLLDCVGSYQTEAVTTYFTKKSDTSSDVIMIITGKHHVSSSNVDQSNIFQAYYTGGDGSGDEILAFNTTNTTDASDDYYGRVVLLVNLTARKFLVQYHGGGTSYVTAAGQGGVDASGVYESGYYFAKSNDTPSGICIDNETRLEAAASNCAAETANWSTAAEVASYLGLTATEQTDLSGFISYFTSGPTEANLSVYPTSVTDAIHIPDRIE